jgi:5'-3' exonuclease
MLAGDKADNIVGIPKIGPAKAEKILKQRFHYMDETFTAYMDFYGEEKGIREFYQNYYCLRMNSCNDCKEFIVPHPIEI